MGAKEKNSGVTGREEGLTVVDAHTPVSPVDRSSWFGFNESATHGAKVTVYVRTVSVAVLLVACVVPVDWKPVASDPFEVTSMSYEFPLSVEGTFSVATIVFGPQLLTE